MRAVIQRVTKAAVYVENELISSIGPGICALIGIGSNDTPEDIDYIVRKLINLRLFPNDSSGKRWDRSVKDNGYEILCVSQFTLFGAPKGNKLDFHKSMGTPDAPIFYETFINTLRSSYIPDKIKDGKFGAYMKVEIENDGPVTILLDSTTRT
uniref:D-aminoacyl-tRNA deacylase n=1 Tax=Syphacia muris TaxID=451379 RepID=A0A0N5ANW7_9BILA